MFCLVTTEKARKLLGKNYQHLSNEEVDNLVNRMSLLADALVDAVINQLGEDNTNEKRSNTNQSLII